MDTQFFDQINSGLPTQSALHNFVIGVPEFWFFTLFFIISLLLLVMMLLINRIKDTSDYLFKNKQSEQSKYSKKILKI